jgi:hypothetical protein
MFFPHVIPFHTGMANLNGVFVEIVNFKDDCFAFNPFSHK